MLSTPNKRSSQSNGQDSTLDRYKRELSKEPLKYHKCDSVEASVEVYRLSWNTLLPEHLVQPVIWEHPVSVYKPENLKHPTALLVVNNGSNNPEQASSDFSQDILQEIAQKTNTIVVSISHVPNQALQYANDQVLREDDSMAMSWRLYMDNPSGNNFLPLHVPMMGAVIKSMDMAQAVLKEQGIAINEFIVTGISKRAWAAWLTMLADARIKAIVPFAAEMLNLPAIVEHTQRSLGGHFPPAFISYCTYNITRDRDTKNFKQLMQIEDPWSYKTAKAEQFKNPKYLVSAGNDDFFMPDNLGVLGHEPFDQMTLRVVPNCDHYGIKNFTSSSLIPFINRYQNHQTMPEVSLVDNQQTASNQSVRCSEPPELVKLFSANNPYVRDFRKNATIPDINTASIQSRNRGVTYYQYPLTLSTIDTGTFQYDVPLLSPLSSGWTASYIEVTFADGSMVTTPVQVKPDSYPNLVISEEEKQGREEYAKSNQLLADNNKNGVPTNITTVNDIIASINAFQPPEGNIIDSSVSMPSKNNSPFADITPYRDN